MRSRHDLNGPTARPPGDALLVAAVRDAGGWLGPLAALSVLGSAATLALPAVLGHAIDRVIATAAQDQPGWGAARGPLVASAALIALAVCIDAVAQLIVGAGTADSTARLRRQLIRHVLAAGPALARRGAEGDLVARLVAGTATAAKAVVAVAGLAGAVLPPLGAVVALALIDPRLALTFAVGMLTVSRAVRVYLRDSRAATAGYLEAQGDIAARMVDALAGARTIAAARTTDYEIERVLTPLDRLRCHGVAVWQNIARLAFRGEPVVLLTQVAVVAVAGLGLSAGRLSPGEMLAASRYAVLAAGIGGMLDELAVLTRARAGAERIVEVLDAPVTSYGQRSLPAGQGELEFSGVTAGPADAPILDGLDLLLPSGLVVAVVGRSGSGKSLLAALAGRLCDPRAGEVRLDGVPLKHLARRSLRSGITYAFERPMLLGESIAESIDFGVDAPHPERVRKAARAAHADGFIDRLPDGYDASLAATPMSGGEIQRIGLARALAQDARVLILDDATSSLDTATEAQIAAALTTELRGRTRLIVTHRLGTAARADLVAWLDGGKVRRLGPHDQLWSDAGYRAIFRPDPEVDGPDQSESEPELVTAATDGGST